MPLSAFRLPAEQVEQLHTLKKRTGVPVSEIVRRAIDAYLSKPQRFGLADKVPADNGAPAPKETPPVIWPENLKEIPALLESLDLADYPPFFDPIYWKSIDGWVESTGLAVFYFDELKAYVANQRSKTAGTKGRHKNLKSGFRNWLAIKIRWVEREHAQEEIRRHSGKR